ncbi:hypothetical protein K435DRAFT_805421 [Dendrothele bispora CBS 962.96]|uniref:Uncharacterized protein n=1 Tax=Dendrothele bispora (strain CBS 962.96) TaxID=1314807 RepID=A0A4S8LB15_DENBC|nr:hypothetical protein K435DRAFT_805421 [Dendrothele bispora CBS 962.96]
MPDPKHQARPRCTQPISSARPPASNRSHGSNPQPQSHTRTNEPQSGRLPLKERQQTRMPSAPEPEDDNTEVGLDDQALIKRKKFDMFASAAKKEERSSKRAYKVLQPYLDIGKYFVRGIDMLSDVTAVINDGLGEETRQKKLTTLQARSAMRRSDMHGDDSDQGDDDEEDMTEKEERQRERHLADYSVIIKRYPFLKERLNECALYEDMETLDILLKVMRTGATEARRNDTKTLKSNIILWIPAIFENTLKSLNKDPDTFSWPKLTPSIMKSERGINNPQIAMLLLPWKHAHKFWIEAESNQDVKRIMQEIYDGDIPPLASDNIPAFLTLFEQYKPHQMLSGLLLGPLLVAAIKCLLTGPSSALEPKIFPTRAGNAKRLSIDTISAPLLQYTIAHVRFALSPIQSWQAKDGKFNLNTFYDWIGEFLNAAPEIWMRKTFKALNMEIFGDDNDDDNDNQPTSDSDLALLFQHCQDYVDSDEEVEPVNDADLRQPSPIQSTRNSSPSVNPRLAGSARQLRSADNHPRPTRNSPVQDNEGDVGDPDARASGASNSRQITPSDTDMQDHSGGEHPSVSEPMQHQDTMDGDESPIIRNTRKRGVKNQDPAPSKRNKRV